MYERKHVAFVSWLTWCPPITPIYLQTTCCYYSLSLGKTPLNIYSWSIHQLSGMWVVSIPWFIVNSAAINIGVQVSLLYPDLRSFEYMPRSAITGSYLPSSFIHTLWWACCSSCYTHSAVINTTVVQSGKAGSWGQPRVYLTRQCLKAAPVDLPQDLLQ
jgi:hypothetical protein